MSELHQVLVLGAGRMGSQIALQCALTGCRVALYDPLPPQTDPFANAGEVLRAIYPQRSLTPPEIDAAVGQIDWVQDLPTAAAQTDLLIEAVPEKLSLKKGVLSRCHPHCPAGAIFATNSSSFMPSQLADASGRPDRLAALHFTRNCGIVEVMPHPGTSAATLAALETFSRRVGTLAITCHREQSGHVLNTLLMALNFAGLTLAERGVARPEDIDRAWMQATAAKMGPFGMLDEVGIDTAWQITEVLASLSRDPQQKRNADYLKRVVDSGRTGRDSGRGFYEYPNPVYQQAGFIPGPR
jgi:3-hydroxybutyryl-CoA dehydrogenase